MLPGLKERMEREMGVGQSAGVVARIVAPPDRQFPVWAGGSVLASLHSLQDMLFTRAEYGELGVKEIHRNCV